MTEVVKDFILCVLMSIAIVGAAWLGQHLDPHQQCLAAAHATCTHPDHTTYECLVCMDNLHQ